MDKKTFRTQNCKLFCCCRLVWKVETLVYQTSFKILVHLAYICTNFFFFRISKHCSIIHGIQYQISYMLLNFQFLKLCELRASILQIQSSTTSVGLAVFTWTHHKRHKCGRSNLEEMILITKLPNYPETVMTTTSTKNFLFSAKTL